MLVESLLAPFVLLSCVYAVFWWKGRRARKFFEGLPTYPPLPFIGNLHQIFGDGEYLVTVVNDMYKIIEDTGLPFAAWVGPCPLIVVADPDDVKAVTNAFVEKPYYYNFARDWVGNGLVTAPSDIWKRSIKKLAGTFTGNIVDGYQDVFNAQAQKLVNQLKQEVGKEPFDILNKYLAYTTLESICQTALGVPQISECIVTHEYYRAFTRVFELFIRRGRNLLLHVDALYRLTPAHAELLRCVAVLHNVSNTVIRKRVKELEEIKRNGTLPESFTENSKPKFKSFLDILFELRESDSSFTEEQMRAEVDTIIVGGQETVATTLFFTFLVIGSKPDIQEKVYNEIKEIFGDSMRPVRKEDLHRMAYCEAVLSETLRLYPPIPFVMRDADRDLQIKSCTIPKGTSCGVNVWAAGRSRRSWGPDAGEYRPERWLQSELPAYSASFLAFSYGKRSCIGKRYAMAILKTVFAYCVRELRFSSNIDKLKLKMDVALKAVSGHLITVEVRN